MLSLSIYMLDLSIRRVKYAPCEHFAGVLGGYEASIAGIRAERHKEWGGRRLDPPDMAFHATKKFRNSEIDHSS